MNTAKGVHDLTYRIKSEAHLFVISFDPPARPVAPRLLFLPLLVSNTDDCTQEHSFSPFLLTQVVAVP